ncbi:Cation transport regulator-like protein 2 [Escovopsis weberi]|uniref:glutathione-specific gamma-glutamylcyclotransferase n=1 Tax=Escovopsis weberi TaxID=150374 RepID=A0A0M8N3B4_ESCWE|nr:Cation transport regulator-like protein 2 [Escovopsis weberi]
MGSTPASSESQEFWLYGYGEDHRGTPQSPGRVVTLIDRSHWHLLADHHDSAPERVWGVAYRIPPHHVEEVKAYLDIREINGYSIHHTPFHPADGAPPLRTLVYIGTPDNAQFVGPQDPQALAEHIARSCGPSGLNRDYLLNLHHALCDLSPDSRDDHVDDLVRRLEALELEQGGPGKVDGPLLLKSQVPVLGSCFRQETSTAEAEEIEKIA